VRIGIGICTHPSLILIHVASRVETYIMVLIEVVFETFEEGKLFIWTLTTRFFRLAIGKDVFWSLKDLSMDDVVTIIGLQQCFVTMDGCNNLGKKQISCRDEDLLEFLFENVNEVEELGGI
jgi:hypothetical protein